ncbi:MAG TPA: TonB family protein, partial [Thermoanaerobaculia bacterium]|nr:TonB family protein [Thermoanaerobaculia bacterium]
MSLSVRRLFCLPILVLLAWGAPALGQTPTPPMPPTPATPPMPATPQAHGGMSPSPSPGPAFNPAEEESILRAEIDKGGPAGASARCQLAALYLRQERPADALTQARECLLENPPERSAKLGRIAVCLSRARLAPPSTPETPSPPPGAADGKPLPFDAKKVEKALTRPEILFRLSPRYTEEARKAHVEGAVIVESIIDEEGCVINAKLLQGLDPGLDEAALQSIRRWVFKPATLEGKPVKVYYSLTVNFK